MEYSFWNGEFPRLLPKEEIGLVLLFAGVSEVIGGLTFGRLSNRFGKSLILLLGSFSFALALIFITSTQRKIHVNPTWHSVSWTAYAASTCVGITDSAFNVMVWSTLGDLYPHNAVNAFTAFNFIQYLGMAVGFWYPLGAPMHGENGSLLQIYVQTALLILATVGFVVSQRIQAQAQEEEENE
jgi:MFS family permease